MEPDDVGQAEEAQQKAKPDPKAEWNTRARVLNFLRGGGNQGAGAKVALEHTSKHKNHGKQRPVPNRNAQRKACKVAAHSRKVNRGSKVHHKQVQRKKAKAGRG